MTWFSGLLTYGIIWWVVLFAVLPWGVRTPEPHEVQAGHASSAPVNPMLWRKALITTLIAAILWLGVYALVASDLISFRAMNAP